MHTHPIPHTHTRTHTHTLTHTHTQNSSISPFRTGWTIANMDMDDIELPDTSNLCSPNLISETINREQPGEASRSYLLNDLIKFEKPVRFEAANPPYNTNGPPGPSTTGNASPEIEAQALLAHLTSTMREIQMKSVKVITTISNLDESLSTHKTSNWLYGQYPSDETTKLWKRHKSDVALC